MSNLSRSLIALCALTATGQTPLDGQQVADTLFTLNVLRSLAGLLDDTPPGPGA